MKKYIACFVGLFFAYAGHGQSKKEKELLRIIDSSLYQCGEQYKFLSQQIKPDRFPVSYKYAEHLVTTSSPEPWLSGFYPGTLLDLYEALGDEWFYQEAQRKMKQMEPQQYNKTSHDLGFMMCNTFGHASQLHHNAIYDSILVNSARSLATRFNPVVGCIRSWDSDAGRFMVIIDNMVNLQLLFDATRLTHDSSFYKIAVSHANTTIKNHFRPDHSSFHLVIYSPSTGAVLKKQTVQGAFDSSAWSRGQAWGLYGFTLTYKETGDKKYLEQAIGIADFITTHPNLPADKIPYWDFIAPGIPNAPRDVSAGAVTCSALLELSQYVKPSKRKKYIAVAEEMLRSLSSPAYHAQGNEAGGFLLKHGTGNFPKQSEVDVPLVYADMYYVEAMLRYKKLKGKMSSQNALKTQK